MHAPIQLKRGTHKGLLKARLHTNFDWNPIKVYGVMINFLPEKVESLSRLQSKPQEGIG